MIGLPLTVLALIIAGCMAAFVVFMGNLLGPAKDAASSYVQALQDQRYDAAFAMRCSQGAGDHDEFVARWTNLSSTGHGVTGFKVVGTSVENTNGTTSGRVALQVRYADGTTVRENMTLTKTGETWQPCS